MNNKKISSFEIKKNIISFRGVMFILLMAENMIFMVAPHMI